MKHSICTVCIIMSLFKYLLALSLLFSTCLDSVVAEIDIQKIGTSLDEMQLRDSEDNFDTDGASSAQKKGSDALSALKKIDAYREKRVGAKESKNKKNENKKDKNAKEAGKKNSKKAGNTELEQNNNIAVEFDKQKDFFAVARVNSDLITNVDVINAIRFMFFSTGKKYEKESAKLILKTIINPMLDDKLQQQYAKFYGIKVKDEEINSRINEIATKNNMTVDEMAEKFKELGINMDMFKKDQKSKMLLSIIIHLVGENSKITEQEMSEAKVQAASEIKQIRYHLYEIYFRVDDKKTKGKIKENADAVLKLLKSGFSFQVLAENISQGSYKGTVGDLGWVRAEGIEKPVLAAISNMKNGEFSDVIETRTGYKIIYVLDKAAPNKAGETMAKYKVFIANMKYKGGLLTQKDYEKINTKIGHLMSSDSASKYKEVCKTYKIDFEEKEIPEPSDYEIELIRNSKQTKKPAIMPSLEDQDSVNILYVVGEEIPDSTIPTNSELFKELSAKKIEKDFLRYFKKIKSTAIVVVYNDMLDKVLLNEKHHDEKVLHKNNKGL